MNFDFKKIIQNELLPNERIIWQGVPCLAKIFTKADFFLIPFSVLWGGFAIYHTIEDTLIYGSPGLFGIPFAVLGAYLILGRFIAKNARKRSTIYAVTNMRILVIRANSKGLKKSIASAKIKTISNESVFCGKNGIGTIIFGTAPFMHSIHMNTGLDVFSGLLQNAPVAFFDIENCEDVFGTYKNVKYQ